MSYNTNENCILLRYILINLFIQIHVFICLVLANDVPSAWAALLDRVCAGENNSNHCTSCFTIM